VRAAHAGRTHAIKNIGQKVLNLNDITINKRLASLIGKSFETPYVSYGQPLAASAPKFGGKMGKYNLNYRLVLNNNF
jgi:hypothetical protein